MNAPALISRVVLPQMIRANLADANLIDANNYGAMQFSINEYAQKPSPSPAPQPIIHIYRKDNQDNQDNQERLDSFSTAQKDLFLQNIENQINQKRNMLLKKRKQLDEARKKNEYLEGVRKDYEKYHKYIANNKQQEMNAMFMLKSYIDDLVINGNLTNTDLSNAKLEQQRILKETQTIKDDLDKIISTK